MYEAGHAAVVRARDGGGPALIEAKTYRFMGHVFGVDTMEYMPKEEMEAAQANDPVPAYRQRLINEGAVSEDDIAALEAAIDKEVADGAEFALASPPPDPEETYTDVYAEVVPA
jgi:pyruvate dehydrogenase E1 component alpha subunit